MREAVVGGNGTGLKGVLLTGKSATQQEGNGWAWLDLGNIKISRLLRSFLPMASAIEQELLRLSQGQKTAG